MSDPAARAAERIADDCRKNLVGDPTRFAVNRFAAIIRAEYANETLMQARAEHLESVLAKVREECELITENLRPESLTGSFAESILAILNESGEAAGGSK